MWVRLIRALGLGNTRGNLSFNKLVTLHALWAFIFSVYYILTVLKQVPPWFVWSFGFGVLGAGFGLKGYLGAAERRTEHFNQSDNTMVTVDAAAVVREVAAAARDAKQGFESSGKVPRVHDD